MELNEIYNALFEIVGRQGHIHGVYDKMFSKVADKQFPLRLLPPYRYADDESFFRFAEYMKAHYPHWID